MSLFKPFRALGYITDDVPFAVQRRGKESYVVVSVGRTWQVYNTAKLTLVLVGPQLRHDVTALACKGDLTFAAAGSSIVECKRVHLNGSYAGHSGRVLQLLVLGDMLLSLGKDRQLLAWKIGEYDAPQMRIQFEEGFEPTCMAHPDTYINKVVVGAADGRMQLWNFATGMLLYTFKGWGSAVRCISPSPALDVVGVGLADGRAVLHNLRYDETVTTFRNASGVGAGAELLPNTAAAKGAGGGACTCISFRTGAGTPLMAAGGGAGVITIWNLEDKRLQTVLRDAHDAPLLALHFFPGEPLLMSAGADNAIKQWVFDATDGSGRLLRFRSGHSAPPAHVRHYGQGLRLLSAGRDRAFRMFSTIQDQQSRELAQHSSGKRAKRLRVKEEDVKLPPIIALDACEVRLCDWCNVITAHEGDPAAYTWRLKHFTLGDQKLVPPPESLGDAGASPVTAVAISPCGNFGIVGSACGRIDRYNLQSGQHRGSYSRRDAGAAELSAHDGAVVGVAVDSCNRLMVSAGWDGRLCTWDFKKQAPVQSIDVGAPLTHLVLHSGSALAAVATDGRAIRMYDIEAGRLVRRFAGHRDRITDLHISADCRWLLSSSMDGTVRAWDIPAAQCLQVMRLGAPVTSLSLSPGKDSLATTHVHKRGVFLWANQLMFGDSASLALYSERVVDVGLPTITSGQRHKRQEGQEEEGDEGEVAGAADVRMAGASSSDDDDDSELYGSDSEDEEASTAAAAADAAAAAAAATAAGPAPHERLDGLTGAPQPLTPSLATLSLLPRSQWENLLHLDLIKARNRPLQPPKKPEAAPFFLPTVPGLEGRPVFDPTAAAAAQQLDKLQGAVKQGKRQADDDADDDWGVSSDDEVDGGAGGGGAATAATTAAAAGGQSRVVRSKGAGPGPGTFLRLLRAGSDAGDYSSFVAHLRGLSPAAVDRQLRAMVLLPGCSDAEVADVAALLECLELEGASNRNFEFCAALLQAVLRLHAEGIMAHSRLAEAAGRLRRRLGASWRRVDYLLQSVRCMVDFYSGNQQ